MPLEGVQDFFRDLSQKKNPAAITLEILALLLSVIHIGIPPMIPTEE